MSNATDPRSCGQVTAVAVHPTLGNGGLVFVETNSHRLTAQLVGNAVPCVGEWLTSLPSGKVGVSDGKGSRERLVLEIALTTVTSAAERVERLRGARRSAAKPEVDVILGLLIAAVTRGNSVFLLLACLDMLVSLPGAATDPSGTDIKAVLICILFLVLHLSVLSVAIGVVLDGARRYRELNFDFWIGLSDEPQSSWVQPGDIRLAIFQTHITRNWKTKLWL